MEIISTITLIILIGGGMDLITYYKRKPEK